MKIFFLFCSGVQVREWAHCLLTLAHSSMDKVGDKSYVVWEGRVIHWERACFPSETMSFKLLWLRQQGDRVKREKVRMNRLKACYENEFIRQYPKYMFGEGLCSQQRRLMFKCLWMENNNLWGEEVDLAILHKTLTLATKQHLVYREFVRCWSARFQSANLISLISSIWAPTFKAWIITRFS